MNHNFTCSIITAPQRVLVPEGVELFQHQKNAITKMVDVEATHEIINGEFKVSTNIAVYGDKVGSGKTRSMVSLIKLNRTPTKPVSETVGGNYLMRCAKNDTQTRAQTTIVIVSSDTIQNWLNEFRICNEPVFVCRKTVELEQLNILLLKDGYICPNTILITNTLFRLVQPPTTFRWSRVIIDDPHRFALNEIPEANFTWLVTSDIAEIIFPRRMYLKKIIPYVFSNDYSKVYESIILKNTDSYVDESIGLSQICTREMGCKTNEYVRNFKNMIPRHAFSELKSGCVDVALNTLNCTVASSDDITKSCSENIRKRLRTNDCPICLDSPSNEIAVTSCCSNAFCLTCLLHSYSMNPKCPLCKSKKCCVDLRVISNDASLYRSPKKQRIVKPLNKTQTLLHHIANNPTTKMLVYAESDILAHIQESFKKMFISFRTILGHNQTTAAVIESFSKGFVNVLIVTEKCPYVDLKMADEIVFYKVHDWSVREHVVGRAQRIGRVNQLLVTDLKYDD